MFVATVFQEKLRHQSLSPVSYHLSLNCPVIYLQSYQDTCKDMAIDHIEVGRSAVSPQIGASTAKYQEGIPTPFCILKSEEIRDDK